MDYSGSHAIVTGGSSGIGRALVGRLAEQGARVSIIALADSDLLDSATAHARHDGAVSTFGADVGNENELREAMAAAVEQHGPSDLLITSAGIARPGPLLGAGRRTVRATDEGQLLWDALRHPGGGAVDDRATPRQHRRHLLGGRPPRCVRIFGLRSHQVRRCGVYATCCAPN